MFGIMNTLLSYMKIVINIWIMLDDFIFCAWWVIVMIETMIEIIWMIKHEIVYNANLLISWCVNWNNDWNIDVIINDDLIICMKYSWYYFDAYKWKVLIMHGRI